MAAWTVHRPSPESETRPEKSARSGLLHSAWAVRSSSHEAMTLPRRQTSAMSATFRSYWNSSGLRNGVVSASISCGRLADPGVLEDVEPLGVGGHQAVLDAVVDHLDEVPRAAGPAVQVALLGRPAELLAAGGPRGGRRCRAPARRRSGRGASRHRARRRSSCSSPARAPRRRRWCPRPRSGCPSASAPRRGGCRRDNTNCRRRSGCRPSRACRRAARSSSPRPRRAPSSRRPAAA